MRPVVVVLAACTVTPPPVAPVAPCTQITVRVVGDDNAPLPDVTVMLLGEGDGADRKAIDTLSRADGTATLVVPAWARHLEAFYAEQHEIVAFPPRTCAAQIPVKIHNSAAP